MNSTLTGAQRSTINYDAAGDMYTNIEDREGSEAGNDRLYGRTGADTLCGEAGKSDALEGGAEAGIMDGKEGE